MSLSAKRNMIKRSLKEEKHFKLTMMQLTNLFLHHFTKH